MFVSAVKKNNKESFPNNASDIGNRGYIGTHARKKVKKYKQVGEVEAKELMGNNKDK